MGGHGSIARGGEFATLAWHTDLMARGWESKSVESQMEAAEERQAEAAKVRLTAAQIQRQRERESLELSRTRVMHDLAEATHPQYRESLEAALRHLEQRIADLQ